MEMFFEKGIGNICQKKSEELKVLIINADF